MSSFTSTLAALLITGIISFVLYYGMIQTSSWHERIPKGLISSMVPKAWLRSLQRQRTTDATMGDDSITDTEGEEEDVIFGDEEGENMVGVSIDVDRRKILERSDTPDVHDRLSRDLEEGFRDDSDEEP